LFLISDEHTAVTPARAVAVAAAAVAADPPRPPSPPPHAARCRRCDERARASGRRALALVPVRSFREAEVEPEVEAEALLGSFFPRARAAGA